VTGGPGALLVSLFNVKWRFSVPAGGVEGSNFCLFSVALPARCASSVSPRFHYRRHAFCFLPLAAILEILPMSHILKVTIFFVTGDYTLKINLEDFEKNSCYAQYKTFKVGDEKVLKP
jgi:hypothetical protein